MVCDSFSCILEDGSASIFDRENSMIDGEMPGVTVLSLSGSLAIVDTNRQAPRDSFKK